MINNNINSRTVVKVVCGNRVGTAFFVAKNLLLTARHNIIDSKTDEEPISIIVDEESYIAEIIHEDKDLSGEACIIGISGYDAPINLQCLSMPIRKGDKYTFMGYPQTIIGQVAGSTVEVEVYRPRDTFYVTDGFNCTATIIGSFMPSQFLGFSGSPIYNDEGLVVGIITHKLDGCVGFVSIAKISVLLEQCKIPFESDHTKYDHSPYSKLTNRKIIDRAINMAGQRYMRDIHVPTNYFDKYFEYAIETSRVSKRLAKYKESLAEIQTLIEGTSLPIFKSDEVDFKERLLESIKGFDISSNDSYMGYWFDILNDNLVERYRERGKTEIKYNELNEFSEKWDSFYATHCEIKEAIEEYYPLIEKPYVCITGSAGSGKTHLLCHLAEEYSDKTNVYLCFGNQFNAHGEIEEQMQQIFEFGNSSYLQDLNDNYQDKRAVIIIDAMNEGVGYHLWQSKLTPFLSEIKKHPNICLIISVRDPFVESLNLPDDFTFIKHNGHSDIRKAKEIYFNSYTIDYTEIPFETPEFRNPLFLKIFCETFGHLNPYERKKLNKLWRLFRDYIMNKEVLISSKADFDPHLRPVRNLIDDIANLSLKSQKNEFMLQDISRLDAHSISNKIIPNRVWSKSLLYCMLEEDLLISSIRYNQPFEETDRIDFAYERMGDFFKAISFLKLPIEEQNNIIDKILKIEAPQAYNFLVALSSIIPDWDTPKREIFDIFSTQFAENVKMKTAFMDSLNYRSIESEEILTILTEKIFKSVDDKTFFSPFLNNVYAEENKLNAKLLYEVLSKLSFAELNIRWTHTVNTLYKERKLELYYSIDKVHSVEKLEVKEQYNYLVFLCWLLSSSYPIVRDRVTRIITYMLQKNPSFSTKLIEQFKDVQDLYVLERLICAIYGSVLLSRDENYIKEVATTVVSNIFKDRIVPPHIHLRHYARLIVERAYHLKLIDKADYKSSTPPYNSLISEITVLDDESIKNFGDSKGTQMMLYSIGVIGDVNHIGSDFYRYILGGNSRANSVFSKISRQEPETNREEDYYTIYDFAKILCNEVRLMGWAHEIGVLDDGGYSHGRYDNKKERIGKKFQWLALYSAIAKLADNNYIKDNLSKELVDYDNPFDIGYDDYYDPTLEITELNNITKANIPFSINKQNFTPEESNDDWFTSDNDKLAIENFITTDDNGDKWVRVSGFDLWSDDSCGEKELFYHYDTYFIDSNQLPKFRDWAVRQNFYGRWMPEKRDFIDFRLKEYIWCSTYKKQQIRWTEKPNNDCPCDVTVTTLPHLQENFAGLSDDENRHSTIALPCEDFFVEMKLQMSNIRGAILDCEDKLAAIDADIFDDKSNGLYIRKDLLDKYLSTKNKTLVMCVLGNKQVLAGGHLLNNIDISGFYYYDTNCSYVGDVCVVTNEKKD